jgi:antitoxin YefM
MLAANFSTVRKNVKGYCDTANKDLETVIITRKECGNASEGKYNNIIENLFVRSNKETYSRLKESINQLEKGQAVAIGILILINKAIHSNRLGILFLWANK